jgi:hypothetical protein
VNSTRPRLNFECHSIKPLTALTNQFIDEPSEP